MTADEYLNSEPDYTGPATTFGYNDPQDNGVGFWGTPTNNPDVVGVSLSRSALAKNFGPDYEKTAYGKPVQVTNPKTGKTIVAPIVDIGPARWVENRQGSTIDLTYAANQALGGTGKTSMEWKVGLKADDFLTGAAPDQSQVGKGTSADDFLSGQAEPAPPTPAEVPSPALQSIGKGHSADEFLAGTAEPSAATQAQEKAPVPPIDLTPSATAVPAALPPPAGAAPLKDIAPAVPTEPSETTSAFGRMAGIAKPTIPSPQAAEFANSLSRENAKEIIGMGQALNQLIISPLLQGAGEAAKAAAPDSPIAKFLDKANKDWWNTMVVATEATRKSLESESKTQGLAGEAGGMIGNLIPQLLGGAATPGNIAVKFLLPAMTSGMDLLNKARERGLPPWQQLAQFAWGFASTEAFVNLPLHVQSAAAGPIMRFLERTTKATLVAGGAHEALRDINNIISPITGGEQQPFSLKELAKTALPMGVFGGVMGENTHVFQDHTVTPPIEGAPATPPEGAPMPGGAVNIPLHGPHTEAFHGSPFEFEQFSSEKIGSGEGAQFFGYGHYVAERKGIGESYKESVKKVLVDGKPEEVHSDARGTAITGIVENGYDVALKEAEDYLAQIHENYEQYHDGERQIRNAQEVVDEIKKLKGKKVEMAPGNLYRVHVKGDKANFLDWDKELSHQSEDMQHALKDANLPEGIVSGAHAYHHLEEAARHAGEPHGAKAASEWLSKRGVLGIRFLDQPSRSIGDMKAGISSLKTQLENNRNALESWQSNPEASPSLVENQVRGYQQNIKDLQLQILKAEQELKTTGTPTQNVVVFDPKNIEILDRNGKKVGTMANPPPGVTAPPETSAPATGVAAALSGIPPKAEPVPAGEERFAPGAPQGAPYDPNAPIPAEPEGAGVGLIASPETAKAIEEVKAIKKEATRLPLITDWIRAVKNRRANKERAAQVVEQMRKELDDHLKAGGAKTEKQRRLSAEAITNYLQAGGDRNQLAQWAAASKPGPRKGYEAALKLTPQEVEAAGRVRQIFNDSLHDLRSMGVDVAEFENYVTGMWQVKLAEKTGMGIPRTMSDYFRFKKQKFFKNYFQGEQEGYNPLTKDIRELLAFYMQARDKTITDRQMLLDMKAGTHKGDPILSTLGSGESVEGPKGPATLVFPNGRPKETSDGRRYVNLDFPALRDWKWVAKDSAGNPVLMQGDLTVHPDVAGHLENLFDQRSGVRKWWESPSDSRLEAYSKGIVKLVLHDIQSYYKGTLFAGIPSGFHVVHQAGEMGLAFRINPFSGLEKIDLQNNPRHMQWARDGLILHPDHVGQQYFQEGVGGGQHNLVTLGLRQLAKVKGMDYAAKVADGIDWWSNWIFQSYLPSLAYKAAEAALPRNMKRYAKELEAGTVTEEQVRELTAVQVNSSIGHPNNDMSKLMSNPNVQHVLSAFLIAPHFTVGRIQKVGAAAFRGKAGREQLVGLGITAASLWLASRLLNTITDGDPHFEWKRAFQVKVGDRWVGMRSLPGDIARAMPEEMGGQNFGPWFAMRTSPFAHLASSWYTGRNAYGQKVSFGRALYDMFMGGMPMPLQGLTNRLTQMGSADKLNFWDHLAGSMGFPIQRYNPQYDVKDEATKWLKKNKPIAVRDKDYGASKYANLEFALEENDPARIKEELKNLKDQGMETKDIVTGYAERIDHPYTDNQKDDIAFSKSLNFAQQQKMSLARARKMALIGRLQTATGIRLKEARDKAYFIKRGQ